jgi:hypothetical protein
VTGDDGGRERQRRQRALGAGGGGQLTGEPVLRASTARHTAQEPIDRVQEAYGAQEGGAAVEMPPGELSEAARGASQSARPTTAPPPILWYSCFIRDLP